MGVLLLLTLLCNIAALPYYFYSTRSSAARGAIGFALFVVIRRRGGSRLGRRPGARQLSAAALSVARCAVRRPCAWRLM